MQGEVSALDAEMKLVSVRGGSGELSLPYDQCVLALGSEASFGDVAGAREHAQPFYTLDDALQVLSPVKQATHSCSGLPIKLNHA